MDADELLIAVSDPDAWLTKSRSLRRAADAVWESLLPSTVLAIEAEKAGNRAAAVIAWAEADGYLQSTHLLYGLALETAFKASILRRSPKDVSLQLTIDGRGRVESVEVKHFGVPIREAHDLEALGHKAGAFDRGEKAIFKDDSDYRAIKEILGYLSEALLWRSRYPTPLRSGPARESDPGLPGKVLGHYIRDWLDPLLDHFQQSPMPASK